MGVLDLNLPPKTGHDFKIKTENCHVKNVQWYGLGLIFDFYLSSKNKNLVAITLHFDTLKIL